MEPQDLVQAEAEPANPVFLQCVDSLEEYFSKAEKLKEPAKRKIQVIESSIRDIQATLA